MPTYNLQVLTEADLLASGGVVGSNGSFATSGSTFTFNAASTLWHTMEVVDIGADTSTLSSDTNTTNSDGGPNADNEGSDGETGTLYDPDGNAVGTTGRVAADRWGELSGSDGSTIYIYEIENYDDIDVYAFSAPLVDGVTYSTTTENARDTPIDYGQMVCLAFGTQILTPTGYEEIENLRVGDEIITVDHGPQKIRWITRARHQFPANDPRLPGHLVHIDAGVAGNARDLRLSPQHRIAVRETTGTSYRELFVPAKHLAEEFGGTIRYARGVREVEFFNLFFDQHELVIAEGTHVESLYPGQTTRKVAGFTIAPAIRSRFPDLWQAQTAAEIETAYGPLARETMTRHALRKAIASGALHFPANQPVMPLAPPLESRLRVV